MALCDRMSKEMSTGRVTIKGFANALKINRNNMRDLLKNPVAWEHSNEFYRDVYLKTNAFLELGPEDKTKFLRGRC